MHQCLDLLLEMVQYGQVSDPAREARVDEVVGEGLLPVEGNAPSAIKAQLETSEIIGMCSRIFGGISL